MPGKWRRDQLALRATLTNAAAWDLTAADGGSEKLMNTPESARKTDSEWRVVDYMFNSSERAAS
jgi:hypothetical protein